MPKKKDLRPEWFKFWRRNREYLDFEQLTMESRGKVFTNVMRYFDGEDKDKLIKLEPIEMMAFRILQANVDASFSDYEDMVEKNRENGRKGGRPKKNPVGSKKP